MMKTIEPVLITVRREAVARALSAVLKPQELTMARELILAENPEAGKPTPERILFWMRVNMPVAAARVDVLL